MMRIISCESGGREDAISPPDYDGLANYGLTQLHGDPQGLDPAYAIDQAHEKYFADQKVGGTGYGPWRGSQGCWGG